MAKAQLAMGKFEAALRNQQRALALSNRDWHLRSYLGTIFRRKGDPQRALRIHQNLSATRTWSSSLLAQVGHDQLALGNPNRAEAAYKRALRVNAKDHEARRGLALLGLRRAERSLARNDTKAAERELRRVVELAEFSPQAERLLAYIALSKGKPQKALTWLDRNSSSSVQRNKLHRLLRARAQLARGEPRDALVTIGRIELARLQPLERHAVQTTAALAELQSGDVESAIIRLDGLPASLKSRAPVGTLLAAGLLQRAEQRWRRGELALAQDDISRLSSLSVRLASSLRRRVTALGALVSVESGKALSKADLRRFDAALADSANVAVAYRSNVGRGLLKSYVRYRGGDVAGAMRVLRPLASRSATAKQMLQSMVRTQLYEAYRKNRYRQAQRLGRRLSRMVRESLPADRMMLAAVEYQLGRRKSAFEEFRALQRQVPEALVAVGIYYDDVQQDERKAFEAFTKYIKRTEGRSLAEVRRWVALKKRIFGFQ